MVAESEHDGVGDDGQGRHVEPLEAPVVPEPIDQFHRGRRIDGEEDAGLRRRGHAADHGLCHALLDPAHGRPRLALAPLGRRPGEMCGQVLARDDPVCSVTGHVHQVDAVLPGHEADGWRGERSCRRGRSGRPLGGDRLPVCAAVAAPAAGGRLGRSVTHQQRHLLVGLDRVGWCGVRS